MNIKPLPTLGSVIALVVFGVGLAAGMWLLPEAASSSNSQSYSVSGARSGLRSTKSGQRNHGGREVVTLSHIKHQLSGPFSGGFLMTTSKLSEEQIMELIAPDEIPALLATLLEQAGVMGLLKLPNSNYIVGGELDSLIFRDLVSHYYKSSPDEAIEWIQGLSTEHDRRLMAKMLVNDLNNKAPYNYYHHEERSTLIESLRPLAREFPSSFDQWVKHSLLMYAARGKTDGFVGILEFEAEYQLGALKDDWTLRLSHDYGFNYTQAINEFTRINQTLSAEQRLTLPSDFFSQWEKSDPEGAQAWRKENPDWSL